MRTAVNILLVLVTLAAAVMVGAYLAAIRVEDAGMALLGIQLFAALTSGAALVLGGIAWVVWRDTPSRAAKGATLVGALGLLLIGVSLAF